MSNKARENQSSFLRSTDAGGESFAEPPSLDCHRRGDRGAPSPVAGNGPASQLNGPCKNLQVCRSTAKTGIFDRSALNPLRLPAFASVNLNNGSFRAFICLQIHYAPDGAAMAYRSWQNQL